MIAWFVVPYKRATGEIQPTRYCAMDDFTARIRTDGGVWSETEILGDRALVKVRASVATLATIAATPTFRRIPLGALNDPISSLTVNQIKAIKSEITDAGYSLSEINAAIPNLSAVTLRQVLQFMATRRKKPRYDKVSDTIIVDGIDQPCRTVEEVEGDVV